MTILLRNLASIAWAVFAVAALWVGAWLMPPPGHWAVFPAMGTALAAFSIGTVFAIASWRPAP